MRRFKWEDTSIGSPDRWPESLKTAIRIILTELVANIAQVMKDDHEVDAAVKKLLSLK